MAAPIRILIDGYNLLHQWLDLAPHARRHTEEAREALIAALIQYGDWTEVPITVVFDGTGGRASRTQSEKRHDLEVVFSPKGETADSVIERVTHLLQPYGTPLVVTDDSMQRHTIVALGGSTVGCQIFIRQVEEVLDRASDTIKWHNSHTQGTYSKPNKKKKRR